MSRLRMVCVLDSFWDDIWMNDFTKKELQDIEVVYRAFCGDGRILTNLELNILKKIKSIIDSYCEIEYCRCSKCGEES